MTPNEYQSKAARTNHECYIAAGCSDRAFNRAELLCHTVGLCGEAGEVASEVKRHVQYGHHLDEHKIALELGDCLWYLSQAADCIGWSLQSIMSMNIHKLEKKVPQGFDKDKT